MASSREKAVNTRQDRGQSEARRNGGEMQGRHMPSPAEHSILYFSLRSRGVIKSGKPGKRHAPHLATQWVTERGT